MKLLILTLLLLVPLCAKKKELVWEHAVVESSFHRADNGTRMGYGDSMGTYIATVRESIYIDAGEWLYHVTRVVTSRAALNLPEGTKLDVAVDGKNLILRMGSKQFTAQIEQKSRAGRHVTDPASRR